MTVVRLKNKVSSNLLVGKLNTMSQANLLVTSKRGDYSGLRLPPPDSFYSKGSTSVDTIPVPRQESAMPKSEERRPA